MAKLTQGFKALLAGEEELGGMCLGRGEADFARRRETQGGGEAGKCRGFGAGGTGLAAPALPLFCVAPCTVS